MASFSGLAIGLSLVFCCFLSALIAELYYLLWWKKRNTNYAKKLLHQIRFKKHEPLPSTDQEPDLELGTNKKDLVKKTEESVEAELMRLHNLSCPPRFLFTIKEETKEDLASEEGKSRKGSRARSLSDIILALENSTTPLLTPLASPRVKSPLGHQFSGINPLFEESEVIYKLRSSPPPKFKFMRDAEEKLYRRLVKEAEEKEGKEGSFAGFVVGKEKERDGGGNLRQCPSCSSQVLPLPFASPPVTTATPLRP